ALLRLSSLARTENDFIETYFQQTCLPQMTLGKHVSILQEAFIGWHTALQRRALVYALHHLNGELSYDHIENAIQIAITGQVGNIAQFTGDIQLRVDYDHLHIEYEADATHNHAYLQITTEKPLPVPGVTQFDDWLLIASRQPITNSHARLIIPPSAKVKIRTRRSGDKFQPLGMRGKRKSIKNWCIDRKIPRNAREGLPIVTIDGEIGAIVLPQAWEIAEWASVHINSQYIVYFQVSKLL
ncbi:MAG: tRNA lysidine(34) synthetase TilS, partial [Chloroflexota bacterium]